MAFIVEDGTGIANATAYVDVAFVDSYHTDRLNTAWTGLSDTALKQAAIIKATDYIDYRWDFIGDRKKAFELQSLKWPRIGAWVRVDEKELLSNQVPLVVQYACAEYALLAVTLAPTVGVDLGELAPALTVDETGGKIIAKREKVGPVEEETKFSGSFGLITLRPYPAADQWLRDVVLHGRKVARG
jgi:hypothetical protein